MSSNNARPAMRRYTRRVLLLMACYVVALIGVQLWFRHSPPTGSLAYVAGALPALPVVGVFFVVGRLLMEMDDEYVRMLLVRQSLIATGFMLSIATAWGFLESFGLLPHAPAYYAAVLWFAGLGVGGCTNWVLESRSS